MIVTIDGPAGAGKSTAAKALAARLGFEFLDTGSMYRAVTLAALRAGIDTDNESQLAVFVASLDLEVSTGRVFLNGEDVTGLIRTSAVTDASGAIANSPAVRRRLVELQRAIGVGRNMVTEGRDQGTIVFPDAECKFFLQACPEVRAQRRLVEMAERGEQTTLDELLAKQKERDERDAARDIAPMKPAGDAIILDSSVLTLEQVAERMEQEIRRRQGERG